MRLIACSSCHRQYDVTHVAQKQLPCHCGEVLENRPLSAVDAAIQRCGSCGAIVQADAADCSFCGSAIVRDDERLSLICPECFARNAEEARFCAACGVGFQPEALALEGEEYPCPCCGGLMPVRTVGGVTLNECPRCHGIWTPDATFDVLVQRATEARRENVQLEVGIAPRTSGSNPAAQQVAYRNCPVCEAHMQRRNYGRSSGVIVDVCRDHGTWLDADELEQIAGFILSGRADERGVVHREHAATSGFGPDAEARKQARTQVDFHQILAQNREGPYADPPRREFRWLRSTLELLQILIR